MKPGTMILIGAAGFAAYYFAQLGTVAKTVQVVFNGIQPQGLLTYNLDFKVQNVGNAGVTLNAMTATVFLNGNALGTASDFTKRLIPGTSETNVTVKFDLNLFSLPAEIMQLVQSGSPNLIFEVNGYANVNGFVVPFTENDTVTV